MNTDFFTDLEAELVGAARQRAAGTRRRGRPLLAPTLGLAALIVALVVVLPRLSEPRRSVSPPLPVLAPPSETMVSVFNGTTEPGLAARTVDELLAAGYPNDGRVGSWRDQTVKRSRVVHVQGSAAEARGVARRLGISTVRRGSPFELSSGSAQVVVILGLDQALRPAEDERRVGADARIVVADADRVPSRDRRLGLRVRDRLRSVGYKDVRYFTRPARDTRQRSTIEYGPGGEGVAKRIGTYLQIDAVGPAPMPEGTDVKVVVGSDYGRTR